MKSAALDTTLLVITAILALFLLLIAISSLILTFKWTQNQNLPLSRVSIASNMTLIFYVLCGICYFIFSIIKSPSIRTVGGSFYFAAQLCMIYTFISRLLFVFKGTALEITNIAEKRLYIAWFGLLILSILISIGSIALALNPHNDIILKLGGSLFVLWILLYIILSIILFILFIRKVRELVVMVLSSESSISKISNNLTADTKRDMEFIHVTIKNSILVPIAIMSFLIFTIIALIIRLSKTYDIPQVIVVDCCIGTICIYLLWKFNDNIYNKMCSSTHNYCQKWQMNSLSLSASRQNLVKNTKNMKLNVSTDIDHNDMTKESGYDMTPITDTRMDDNKDDENIKLSQTHSNPIQHSIPFTLPLTASSFSKSNPLY